MKNILRTTAYFDIYNWPLRAEEIWKWQFNFDNEKILSLPEIFEVLKEIEHTPILPSNKENTIKSDVRNPAPKTNIDFKSQSEQETQFFGAGVKTVLQEKDGFYFFHGKENMPAERAQKYLYAERKYKKIIGLAKIFSFFPFIKMISVCNDLGYSNAPDGSDIDLFIVSSRKRVWLARLLVTGFLKLFKMRPGENQHDAVCPSFFVDEDSVNLEKLALKNALEETDDPHFIYWICQMSPILEKEKFNKKFGEENKWINKFLPNAFVAKEPPARRLVRVSPVAGCFEKIFQGFFGNWLEKKAKKIQLDMMPENLKQAANKNTNIVVTDSILKFHTHDSREIIREKFRNL